MPEGTNDYKHLPFPSLRATEILQEPALVDEAHRRGAPGDSLVPKAPDLKTVNDPGLDPGAGVPVDALATATNEGAQAPSPIQDHDPDPESRKNDLESILTDIIPTTPTVHESHRD